MVLAEDTFEGEPEALCGMPRGGVERVALPLNATVPQVIERMAMRAMRKLRPGVSTTPYVTRGGSDVVVDSVIVRRDH
jgi:hypothetical protein